ncbi:hypothetical protein LEP1GSC058_0005 [Leptospira fainei serovar Hurstbridge str. BUT 6]|uniref:Uncharacterized protein n=1 Tax=Leptospira fainei serovar Hurstbridge str. BUT 6 TaxID=1193011 RepID=S3V3A9_9LEPT|nr:hypothetical protein LEP1GSC058_0005 [Leptospira fainei serovar Hurstbridge str. BUT 6]
MKHFCTKGRSKSILVNSNNLRRNYIHLSPRKTTIRAS